MKNLCLSMFIVLFIYSSAESCDQTACVASKIFESTVSFRTEGTKKYYCEDNIVSKVKFFIFLELNKKFLFSANH
jgi:hypothetical protein